MRTTQLFIAISLALSVSAAAQQNNRNGVQRGNNRGFFGQPSGQQNNNAAKNANNGKNTTTNTGKNANTAKTNTANAGKNAGAGAAAGAAAGGAAAGAAAGGKNSTAAATGAANNTAAAAAASGDAQTSTTLDPKVIATGFANNGQDVPTAGQVASLTSTNNFINFCLTVPNLPITNGKQITTGSCNPAPMGSIPSSDNMPSAKFTVPKNGDTLKENTAFTITMAIANMQTGAFVNAQENYFSAPQQLNAGGQIIGHSHVVVEQLTALDQTTPTDPKKFAFFKGLNAAAVGGVLTADVTAGLPAGVYKLSSINTAANHQPVLVPIAQHGSLDDAVYFTVTADGQAAAGAAAAGAAGAGAAGAAAGAGAGAGAAGAAAVKAPVAGAKAVNSGPVAGAAGSAATKSAVSGVKAVNSGPAASAAKQPAAGAKAAGQQQGKQQQQKQQQQGKRFHARAFAQL